MFNVNMKMGYETTAKEGNKPWDRPGKGLALRPLPHPSTRSRNKKGEETISKIPSKTTFATTNFILNRFQIVTQVAGYRKTICLNTKQKHKKTLALTLNQQISSGTQESVPSATKLLLMHSQVWGPGHKYLLHLSFTRCNSASGSDGFPKMMPAMLRFERQEVNNMEKAWGKGTEIKPLSFKGQRGKPNKNPTLLSAWGG